MKLKKKLTATQPYFEAMDYFTWVDGTWGVTAQRRNVTYNLKKPPRLSCFLTTCGV